MRQDSGHVDLLVANAGIAGPGLVGLSPRASASEFARSAWATPMPDFNAVYALNCTATYYTILAFLDLLEAGNKRRQPGSTPLSQVVVTSSMVAFQRDPRYGFAYLSSKAALISMVKSFATHGVPWGIRFNTIAAGRKQQTFLFQFAFASASCLSKIRLCDKPTNASPHNQSFRRICLHQLSCPSRSRETRSLLKRVSSRAPSFRPNAQDPGRTSLVPSSTWLARLGHT